MEIKAAKNDFGHICRVCLKNSASLNHLFAGDVPHMLKFCGFLEVNECDQLPEKICDYCRNLVIKSYELKQLCMSSKSYYESVIQPCETLTLNVFNCFNNSNTSNCEADGTGIDLAKYESAIVEQNSSQEINVECEDVKNSEEYHLSCDKNIHFHRSQNHSKEEHAQAKFECHICKVKFQHKQDVSVHQSIHDNLSVCNVCKKIFSSMQILKRHIKTHMVVKSHTCKMCSKSFVESYDLRKHIKRHHLGIPRQKNYACTNCEQRFTDQYYLKVHQRKHTGEKPLECSLCDKCFYDPRCLKTHLDAHKGIKPYLCNYCGKSFFQNSHLKQHIIVHDQKKPYMCEMCNKRFTQSASLRRHQKVHSKHVCDICNRTFSIRIELCKHLENDHHIRRFAVKRSNNKK